MRPTLDTNDITIIATEIRNQITAGATERALIAMVAYLARQFPDMTSAELSAAMREAMSAPGVLRPH